MSDIPNQPWAANRYVVWRPGGEQVDGAAGKSDIIEEGVEGFRKAVGLAKELTKYGGVTLELDDRYQTTTMPFFGRVLQLPSSADEPGGVWDMEGIKLTHARFTGNTDGRPRSAPIWEPQQDCVFHNLSVIEGHGLIIMAKGGVTSVPFPLNNGAINCEGAEISFATIAPFVPPHAPLIKPSIGYGGIRGSNGCHLGIGFVAISLPFSPVLDMNGAFMQAYGINLFIRNGAIMDSAGGAFMAYEMYGTQGQGRGERSSHLHDSSVQQDQIEFEVANIGNHAVSMSPYRKSSLIPVGGLANRLSHRMRIATDAGDITVKAPNCGSYGCYYAVDNFGSSNKGIVEPNEPDQTINGKFKEEVPAKTRHTYRSDWGQNDNMIVAYTGLSGTFTVGSAVDLSWTGGTGEVLDDDGTKLVVRLVTGAPPAASDALSQSGSGASATASGAPITYVPNMDRVSISSI